eukprot:CAMPEP_0118700996 /NCGR_PEP_ID=MMETSP0800-20121206/16954_1 /TAXON_ID=210618 ORGANISM="Striatella unipunctata, Strain CCMP2910" /NCGR_SAMPLE_ID=MMETSP0800 /ASSEMBLY_ACC=CAM_ASM_000638 /LENGTH=568 /DNA_ID=CAMNT_0006601765 /DNA_START=65 /DNA_END=1771 /DNA_ORIENTATION=-
MVHKPFILAFIGFCSFLPLINSQRLRTTTNNDVDEHNDQRALQTNKYCKLRTIDFDDLKAGEMVHKQYDGVIFRGKERTRPGNAAMVFDTHTPTGGDKDLKFVNRANVLILSEDGNKDNPNDSAKGGVITITFNSPVQMESMIVMDMEKRGQVRFFDGVNKQLGVFNIPTTGNNGQTELLFDKSQDVRKMTVWLSGSGAIDDITYRLPECDDDSEEEEDKDFGIRFSKVVFEKDVKVPDGFLPLQKQNFPPRGQTDLLLRQSLVHSVITQEDFEVKRSIAKIIQKVGGLPTHANGDPNSPFWDEFREVIQAQKDRRGKVAAPQVFPLADIWKGFSLDEVAEAVHDEFPGTNQAIFMRTLIDEPDFKLDDTIIPRRGRRPFLRREVMMADLNTWAIGIVGPYNFGAKWHGGRARPEEIAWLIAQDELTEDDGVPIDIIDDIKQFELSKATDFTGYAEGCPPHPSWPAMHSAASSSSFLLSVILELTEEQSCQVKLVDYGVSFARTVAGVHYRSDNIDGLNMGQEVLAGYLGEHLEKKYGADREWVDKKIEKMRFDWKDFDPWECIKKFG